MENATSDQQIFSRTSTPQEKINTLSFLGLRVVSFFESTVYSTIAQVTYQELGTMIHRCQIAKPLRREQRQPSLFLDRLFCLQLTAYILVAWRGHFSAGLGNQELMCPQRQESSLLGSARSGVLSFNQTAHQGWSAWGICSNQSELHSSVG